MSNFHEKCLQAHNAYRAKHHVEPLKLDATLNRFAQEWADVSSIVMQHRPNNKYGENIYYYWSSDLTHTVDGKDAVDSWYDERTKPGYVFGRSQNPGTGHFTQVVWKGSKLLGVGVSKNAKNQICVVCNYDPPGNYVGQDAANVLRA